MNDIAIIIVLDVEQVAIGGGGMRGEGIAEEHVDQCEGVGDGG
jgi:hypothetical protein